MLDDVIGSVLSAVVGVPARREGPRGSAGRRRDRTRFRVRLRRADVDVDTATIPVSSRWRTFVLDVHDDGVVTCRRRARRHWHRLPYAGLALGRADRGRGWRERHRIVAPVRLAGGGSISVAVWEGDTGSLARVLARSGAAATGVEDGRSRPEPGDDVQVPGPGTS